MDGGGKTAAKKGGRQPILQAEKVAAAIVTHDGNIAAVAKQFGVARQSVQQFIQNNPHLQGILHDAREGKLDEAESSLYQKVKDGEGWAVCFFLKTQGKSRGYVEREKDPAIPPLEALLEQLRPDVAAALRGAIAAAVLGGGTRTGGDGPGAGG